MNAGCGISAWARHDPERPAILFEDRHPSYGQLDDLASRIAARLNAAGVGRGDRVALHLANIPVGTPVENVEVCVVDEADRGLEAGERGEVGHPQGPTGLRLPTELIETLRLRGAGVGLFTGCSAGDTGFALVVRAE